jgi:hypothetical protein
VLIMSAFDSAMKETIVKDADSLMNPVKFTIEWILWRLLAPAKLERNSKLVDSIQAFAVECQSQAIVMLGF